MLEIPITQLFMAGVFAIVFTEVVKWIFGITESDIGIHSSNSGKLIKARVATVIYAVVIVVSNVIAFYSYEMTVERASSLSIPSVGVDAGLVFASIVVIYVYLKVNHYSR